MLELMRFQALLLLACLITGMMWAVWLLLKVLLGLPQVGDTSHFITFAGCC
jgi:hypothetical protein